MSSAFRAVSIYVDELVLCAFVCISSVTYVIEIIAFTQGKAKRANERERENKSEKKKKKELLSQCTFSKVNIRHKMRSHIRGLCVKNEREKFFFGSAIVIIYCIDDDCCCCCCWLVECSFVPPRIHAFFNC